MFFCGKQYWHQSRIQVRWVVQGIMKSVNEKALLPLLGFVKVKKSYRPNAHLLYIVMHYRSNGNNNFTLLS